MEREQDWVAEYLDVILGKIEKAKKKENVYKVTFVVNVVDDDDRKGRDELLGRLGALGYTVKLEKKLTWRGLTSTLETYGVEWNE